MGYASPRTGEGMLRVEKDKKFLREISTKIAAINLGSGLCVARVRTRLNAIANAKTNVLA